MSQVRVNEVQSYSGDGITVNGVHYPEGTGVGGVAALPDVVTPGTYGSASKIPVPTIDAKGRVTSITEVDAPSGGAGLFLGSVADDAARDALPSPAEGAMVFNVARLKNQRHASGEWVDAQDAAVQTYNPASFGAVGDGVTDNTAAYATMLAAIAAEQSALGLDPTMTGCRIHFPPGVWIGDLKLENRSGVIVQGQGPTSTFLRSPAGTSALAPLQLRSTRYCKILDVGLQPTPTQAGCLSGRLAAGSTVTATGNMYENVHVVGGLYGFWWKGDGEFTDLNNDLASLYRCRVESYIVAGYYIGHSQCKHVRFDSCEFSGGFVASATSSETFDDPAVLTDGSFSHQGDGWSEGAGPSVAVAGGVLTFDATGLPLGVTSVLQNQDAASRNGTIRVVVDSVNFGDTFENVALILRRASNSNFYQCSAKAGAVSVWSLSGGVFTQRGTVAATLAAGDVWEFGINETTATVSINGTVVLTCTAPALADDTGVANAVSVGGTSAVALSSYEYTGSVYRDSLHCGVLATRGSFHFINGGGGANAGADFVCCGLFDASTIEGVDSEGSNRFAKIGGDIVGTGPGATGAPMPVTVRRNRIAGGGLHPDGYWMTVRQPGPILVHANTVEGNGAHPTPRIWYSPLTGGSLDVRGNDFPSDGSGDMATAGAIVDVDWTQPYDHHIECRGNMLRNDPAAPGSAAGHRYLPRNLGDLYFYQGGTYATDNTKATVLRSIAGGVPGERLTILARDAVGDGDARIVLRHGSMQLEGSADWTMPAGATVTLVCIAVGTAALPTPAVWYEESRTDPTKAAAPDFGSDDIAKLEYDVGGAGALLRIYDRRFGVTEASGKAAAIAEARGISAPDFEQTDATKRFSYDAGTKTVTVAAGQWMTAAVPDNPPVSPWAPFWVYVYRNRAAMAADAAGLFLRTTDGGAHRHALLLVENSAGTVAQPTFASGIYAGTSGGVGAGTNDALVGGVTLVGHMAAYPLAAFDAGDLPETGSNVSGVSLPFDAVELGCSADAVAAGFSAPPGHEWCAALELSVADPDAALAAIKAWAAAHHWV